MDHASTDNCLADLFKGVPAVTIEMTNLAMTRARVIDDSGNPPNSPEWVPTFDEWIAAAEVAETLHLQGAMSPADTVKQFTSEGATFVFNDTAPDWGSVAAYLRGRSTLAAATGWAMVEIPSESTGFTPRSEAWL